VVNGTKYLDLDNCYRIAEIAQDYIHRYQGDPDVEISDLIKNGIEWYRNPEETVTRDCFGHEVTQLARQSDTVTRQVLAMTLTAWAEIVASVLAVLAGLFGLLSVVRTKRGRLSAARLFGWCTLIVSLAGNLYGKATGYNGGYTYPLAVYENGERVGYEFAGHTVAHVLILLLIAAVLFLLFAYLVKKPGKDARTARSSSSASTVTADDIYRKAVANTAKDEELARLRMELEDLKEKNKGSYKE